MMRTERRRDENSNYQKTIGDTLSIKYTAAVKYVIDKLWNTFKKLIGSITVEPVIFFYAIGFGVTTIITSSLYMEKICKVKLN